MLADEIETSVSLVVQPENVRLEKAVKESPTFALSDRWLAFSRVFFHSRAKFPRYGTHFGVMGDPTVATRETGEKIVKAVVDDLAEITVEVVKSEGK